MSAQDKFYGVAIVIIVVLATLAFGFSLGRRDTRAEAIRLGHAEWVADAHGQPVFRWKDVRP